MGAGPQQQDLSLLLEKETRRSALIDTCLLCGAGGLSVILKPPTAGISILSIDGGGVRGAVPLEFMSILQDTLGDDCPIQDLFDLALGTRSDGIYDVRALEKVLKDVFGAYERMFGSVQVNLRTKIAVTATTISDASSFIFSNYNGVSARQDECGYKLPRPAETKDEPFTWEA
ncbi:MAG: hypothetical protein Q9181_004591 [Wetmoreana brouardii]